MEKNYKRKMLVIGVLFLFLGASATLCVSAVGPWSDNFDSYTDGQLLDGTSDDGGWQGWASNPGAYGTVTSDESHSSPYSVAIADASDCVHLYGDTTGEWNFIAWQFIPIGQSGGTYGGTFFIMNDVYTNGGADTHWAVQIQFDNVNNVLYPQFETEYPVMPIIYGQWVQIRVHINFDTDWFQFYYNEQLLYEKAWTNGVQGLDDGTLCFAALDLFADGSTVVYYDDLSWLPATEELTCSAGGPYNGEINEVLSFTGFATGGTEPYTWAWDFGDGATAAVQNPTHAYTAPGTYNVTLTVTDAADATVTDTTTATIIAPQPVLEIGAITGGFGIKSSVKNTGEGAATNVDWTITLDGKLVFLGKSSTGTIATLAPAGSEAIKAGFILGFGKTNIVVSATCDEGVTAEATASGFVFGPFILGVK
jgi:hypothetical protein